MLCGDNERYEKDTSHLRVSGSPRGVDQGAAVPWPLVCQTLLNDSVGGVARQLEKRVPCVALDRFAVHARHVGASVPPAHHLPHETLVVSVGNQHMVLSGETNENCVMRTRCFNQEHPTGGEERECNDGV